MYQDKDFTGGKSSNVCSISNLFWEANSKLIFEVFIECFHWLLREMAREAAKEMMAKMAGNSRKVTEKMVIQFFKMIIPPDQFLDAMEIVETLKT